MKTEGVRGDPASIAAYYDQTWLDYRMLWLNPGNRAMHFGYWDENTKNHAESLINMNRVIADNARLKPGQLVMDAGSGVGGTAMWVAANRQAKVIGITVTPSQVERSSRYAKERNLEDQVAFGVQDYTKTAFPDETFDAIYGLETVNYALDKRDFIKEAYRLLKPGGRLAVQDGFKVHRPLNAEENKLQESWLAGWMVPNLSSREEFAEWSKEAGFVDVEDIDCTPQVRKSCQRLYRITMALLPGAKIATGLGFRSKIQQGNVRAARDQWLAMKKGLWGYGIVMGNKPGG